ncbi:MULTISPECIES: hypothetical protein [unclassified Nostoc]|uniref:hypothetical protein n=1 Tax=unclassified Nostoc TaxID=2593658 RepID=UPI00263119DF|nr:hypothetical protein [Nostoc sp. S13]MDF5737200.1 hypothetical protein [Nostoc sp. S13]
MLSATTLVVFVSLSCLPAQRLLAQDAPVAGKAIEENKYTFSEPPVAGLAIQESQRRPKRNQLAFRPNKSVGRGESTTRTRRRERVITRREYKPRVRSVIYTPERESIQERKIRRPVRSSPKIPSIPQNFPIRRG